MNRFRFRRSFWLVRAICVVQFAVFCFACLAVQAQDIYLYEPIVVRTLLPSSGRSDASWLGTATIETPQGTIWTNHFDGGLIFGKEIAADFSTNFLCVVNMNLRRDPDCLTNVFGAPGTYIIKTPGFTNQVAVVAPTGAVVSLLHLLSGDVLVRIALMTDGSSRSEATKTCCQQILQVSPDGAYAEYARAYLYVDSLYQLLNPTNVDELASTATPLTQPDFTGVLTNMIALGNTVTKNQLKPMVRFHEGYVQGLAHDVNATNTLQSLVSDFPLCLWSSSATKMLSELAP
jgi:hypothetical protein